MTRAKASREDERRPARSLQPLHQAKAHAAVDRGHLARLMVQHARQDGDAPGADRTPHVGREVDERAREDIGQHQIEPPRPARRRMPEARRPQHAHARCHAVEPRIRPGDGHGARIVVDGQHPGHRQQPGRRDCEHAAAAAEVQHAGETTLFRQLIQGFEAERRGGVVARAEGLSRLDLHGAEPHRKARAVVAAVHDEPPRGHRRQRRLRQRHPVLVRHRLEPQLPQAREVGESGRDGFHRGRGIVVGLDQEARRTRLEQRHRQCGGARQRLQSVRQERARSRGRRPRCGVCKAASRISCLRRQSSPTPDGVRPFASNVR